MSLTNRVACTAFFTALLFSSLSISAQDSLQVAPPRVYTAMAVGNATPPVIDGLLTDDAWENAAWAGDFIEWLPDENTPPDEQSKFRILYDQKNLYVAIRCFESDPENIDARLSRRDGFVGDRVGVVIDSYNDKRTAFTFVVNAAGVKGDELISNNGDDSDDSWNPIWYTDTNIDEEGWTAEMRIPLSQIKFGKADEQVWGLQVARMIFRENQWSVWDRIPREAPGWVSEFGELHGLYNIEPQKQLEIQPFVVTQWDTYPEEAGNPFRDGSDVILNGGLDAKIGITNDLTLDLTVNPDFGQVDADPGAIALDGFQIFFQERRPFFIENKNIFDYEFANGNDNLFYSRRIGRSPQGFPDTTTGEFVDIPNNTTILGAAKFSGKTKNGWSIGVLESLTGKMNAEIDNNGERREEIVEPMTNYAVVRAQKDFNERNTFVGGMLTSTNRKIEGDLDFLHTSAFTGGVDFRHMWKNRNYFIEGNIIASHVTGSEEAITATQQTLTHLFQRTDAGHVEVDPNRTSLTGTAGRLSHGKEGGGNWRYEGGAVWRSPELELNDIGFLRQADEIIQYADVNRLWLIPTSFYRSFRMGIEQFTTYDFDGNHNRTQYEFEAEISYQNRWFTEVGFGHKPRIFSNTVLRGGPRWRWSDENFAYLFFGSDRSRKVFFTLGYVRSEAAQNNFTFSRYVARLGFQPFDAFNLSINTTYRTNPNKTQYVTETAFNGDPRYIMAEIDQKTFSTAIRFNYSVNPNLSVQFYGEPFISRGRYSNFNYVNNSLAEDLDERITLFDTDQISFADGIYLVDEDIDGNIDYSIDDPDFSFVQFRSNLVARWEYIPGSEIFLVWSRGVTGFGDPLDSLGRSLDGQILGEEADDTFLIKVTYRFVK
ncbi:MAG: carbohydrate binding family 9 domain-containing protein [Eudoraea sp.]|nr:carbohydrate binding family 9 domain-containing protein [Eudoraea sp.]